MKAILIIALTISSGCNSFPTIQPLERSVLSLEYDKCRSHMYDPMTDRRIGQSYDEPIEACEKMVGFKPDEWAKLKIWFGRIKIWRKQSRRR